MPAANADAPNAAGAHLPEVGGLLDALSSIFGAPLQLGAWRPVSGLPATTLHLMGRPNLLQALETLCGFRPPPDAQTTLHNGFCKMCAGMAERQLEHALASPQANEKLAGALAQLRELRALPSTAAPTARAQPDFTAAQVDHAYGRYTDGEHISEVADDLGLKPSSLYQRFAREGRTMRTVSDGHRVRREQQDPEKRTHARNALSRAYQEHANPATWSPKAYMALRRAHPDWPSWETLRRLWPGHTQLGILREAGVPALALEEQTAAREREREHRRQQARQLHREYVRGEGSLKAAAAQLGISASSLRKRFESDGLPLRNAASKQQALQDLTLALARHKGARPLSMRDYDQQRESRGERWLRGEWVAALLGEGSWSAARALGQQRLSAARRQLAAARRRRR